MANRPANDNAPKWLRRLQEQERTRESREAAIDGFIYVGFLIGVVLLAVWGWRSIGL